MSDQPPSIPAGSNFSNEQAIEVLKNIQIDDPTAQKALTRLTQRYESGGPVSIQTLKDAVLVGRFSRLAGMRDLIRGLSFEVHCMAASVIQENNEYIRDLKKKGKFKYAEQIVNFNRSNNDMFKIMNESQKLMLSTEGSLAQLPQQAGEETPTAATFAPGQTITPPKSGTVVIAQHAHFPQEQEKK